MSREGLEAEADYRMKKARKKAAATTASQNAARASRAAWQVQHIEEAGAIPFARCPEHGLHGRRDDCFVCGGPVELVAMIPAPIYTVEALDAAEDAYYAYTGDEERPAMRLAVEAFLAAQPANERK